jgi:DNA-binding transcriptional MerR regulator
MPRPPRFTIRAASVLTGINQNTLRAWERRHGLLGPERTPKGYRLYSNDDIERLHLIRRALEAGVSIGRVHDYLETPGRIRSLPTSEVGGGAAEPRPTRLVEVSLASAGLNGRTTIRIPAGEPAWGAGAPLAALTAELEQAALRLDRPALERAFGRAVGLHSLRQAFHRALAPALLRVAQRSPDDPAVASAERLLAGFGRERLVAALVGLRPLHQPPRAVFACLPGERHEVALMLLALEVAMEGVSALYLGADTPVPATQQAARATGARAVVLSATLPLSRERTLEMRERLACLPGRPRLLAGGPAAWQNRGWLESQDVEVLSSAPEEAGAQVLRAIGQD